VEWSPRLHPAGLALWFERVSDDGAAVRQRHYLHLGDGRIKRHWAYAAAPRTPDPDTRDHGGVLLDTRLVSYLGDVVEHQPLISAGWSGNSLERLALADGRRLIAKRIVPGSDWIDRHTKDEGREALLFTSGVLDRMPRTIDHAIVAAERDGDAWWVAMRDVSASLLPDGKRLSREEHRRVLAAVNSMWGEFWGEPPHVCALQDCFELFSPAIAEAERDGLDLVPKQYEVFWEAFADAVDSDEAGAVLALLKDPGPLVAELEARGTTLIHADIRDEQIGLDGDRLILLDWGRATQGHPVVDFFWSICHLDADAREAGQGRLGGAFAEVHDPSRAPEMDSTDPVARLRFMAHRGARVLPVPYVQPQLRPRENRVDNLLLLTFPVGEPLSYTLPSSTVLGFLRELYRALDVPNPEQDSDFNRMADELRGEAIELLTLEFRSEAHELRIHDYAIAVHVVLDPAPDEPRRLPPRSAHLDSFEQDMLAYAFRGAPPLRTVLVPTPEVIFEVEMLIPPVMCYRSEGRHVVLTCSDDGMPRRRRLRVKAARTDFLRSGLSVLHVILTPCPDSDAAGLSEFDIVKVIKIWEGGEGLPGPGDRQEWLTFQPRTGPPEAFIDLAKRLLAGRRLRHVKGSPFDTTYRVGTIQFLNATSTADDQESITADLIGAIVRLRDDPAAFRDAREHNEVEWRRLRAVGGIVQGLLDFEEIDESELSDGVLRVPGRRKSAAVRPQGHSPADGAIRPGRRGDSRVPGRQPVSDGVPRGRDP
jgi:hypothetical protein